MSLDLTDEETAALIRGLRRITDNDRYQFSERIRACRRSSRNSARNRAAAPPKVYAPPRAKRRRGKVGAVR
jgi:hypothetical protein